MQFRIDAGDLTLKQHLQTVGHNAVYTSKGIQNNFINICGKLIQDKILQKVKQAAFYSIIADEATDASNVEQLSISIHFVGDDNKVYEKFICFHPCQSGVTGEAIDSYIFDNLELWNLDPNLIRGQAYDGAGAMAGQSKGAAACIKSKYSRAIYTHCASHRLNLCVVKCCSICGVSNMM